MEDLTALVDAAASSLSGEEMIEAKSFSLYDSMSALELMDPRMDPDETTASLDPESVELKPTSEEASRAKWKLTEKDLAWQTGASSEEYFDCALTPRLDLVETRGNDQAKEFGACLNLSLRIAKASHALILWGDVYEEEDFYVCQPPLPDIDEEEEFASNSDDDHVAWRARLLSALKGMATYQCPAQQVLDDLDKCLEIVQRLKAFESSTSRWCVFSSERGGIGAETNCDRTRAACAGFIRGLRKVAELRLFFENGCGNNMCGEETLGEGRVLYRLLSLVQNLQGEAILPRSLAALELGGEYRRSNNHGDQHMATMPSFAMLGRGSKSVRLLDVVVDGVRCDGTPACVAAQRSAAEWTGLIACPRLLDLLHTFCFNRARLHQKLFRGPLLEAWNDVVSSARQTDASIVEQLEIPPHRYLEVFAVRVALYLMNLNLELNVELELVATPAELEPLFFYREFIARSDLRLVSSARQYKSALELEMEKAVSQTRDSRDECLEVLLQATLALCRGMRVMAAAAGEGQSSPPFGSEDSRYRFRFEHFRVLEDPPYVNYKQFKELTTTGMDPKNKNNSEQLLDYANEYLQRAKQATDTLLKGGFDDDAFEAVGTSRAALLAMAKVAVANRVAIAKLKSQQIHRPIITDHEKIRFHPHYPVFGVPPS